MYLGSAAAMLALPSLAAAAGPASLLRAVGALGLAWLALWLAVGREVAHRCARPRFAGKTAPLLGQMDAAPHAGSRGVDR
jgi:hypothetical protein